MKNFRRCVFSTLFLVSTFFINIGCQSEKSTDDFMAFEFSDLDKAILGALVYLDDNQVRNRIGQHSCLYDASDEEEGCINDEPDLPVVFPYPLPSNPEIRNHIGEWASFIYYLPNQFQINGSPFLRTQDSNLFVSTFISYPLFLFEMSNRNGANSPIERMLDLAVKNIQSYKRNNAYNFWPKASYDMSRTSPLNISMDAVEYYANNFLDEKNSSLVQNIFREDNISGLGKWVEKTMTDKNNTDGVRAFFNIPNDADDTSMALAVLRLYELRKGTLSSLYESSTANIFEQFLDINRRKEDGRDTYKGSASGAYLTWLHDEDKPVYSQPDKGVIPLGVNNVDMVVNANVAFSLSLLQRYDMQGYDESIALLKKVINGRDWLSGSLYYPQHMMFPYAVTRAWRDAGAGVSTLRESMKQLMIDLLGEQNFDTDDMHLYGSFSGGEDSGRDLSTALACTALINMGESLAIENGVLPAYRKAIKAGISYLLRTKQLYSVKNSDTFMESGNLPQAYHWNEGAFFSASYSKLAQWRSEPFTTAMVLEAFAKYRIGYFKINSNITDAPKIRLVPPRDTILEWKLVF